MTEDTDPGGTGADRIEIEEPAPGVRVIAFNRPEVRNAFDTAMYQEVTAALRAADADDAVGAVVLTGRGSAFTSGQDLAEMAAIATGTAVEGAGQGFIGLLDCLTESLRPPPRRRQRGGGRPRLHPSRPLRSRPGRRPTPGCACPSPSSASRPRPRAASCSRPPWAGSRRRGSCSPRTGSARTSWSQLGLALRSCDPGAVLDETVELAARVAAHPRAATRAITSLMRAARRDAVLEANRREQAAFARLLGSAAAAGHPGRLRRPGPGLTVRLGITAALTDLDLAPAALAAAVEGARLRLALAARAHPSARRARTYPPRWSRACGSTTTSAASIPLVALVDRGRRDHAHRARHRHPPGRAARPHRPGQAGGDARPSLRRPGHARRRVRLEPHRGRGPRRRLGTAPRTSSASTSPPWRPSGPRTRPSTTASSSTSARRGPGPSRCSSRACAPGRRRRHATPSSPPSSTYADGWIPIGGSGLSEALPRLHALAEEAGRDPGDARRRPLRHHRRRGQARALRPARHHRGGAAGPGRRRGDVRAGRARVAGAPRPVRGHTGATMTDLIDDTTPRLGSTTPLPRIISVDDHIVEPRAPVGDLAAGALPATGARRRSAAASARWSTSAAAPTARRSTPTVRRPTAGSTRISSTSTSATSPPSASTATT